MEPRHQVVLLGRKTQASPFVQPKLFVNLYGINPIAHLQTAPRSFKQRIALDSSNLHQYFVYELCTEN